MIIMYVVILRQDLGMWNHGYMYLGSWKGRSNRLMSIISIITRRERENIKLWGLDKFCVNWGVNCNTLGAPIPDPRACQVTTARCTPTPHPSPSIHTGSICWWARGVKGQVGGSIPTGNNPPSMNGRRRVRGWGASGCSNLTCSGTRDWCAKGVTKKCTFFVTPPDPLGLTRHPTCHHEWCNWIVCQTQEVRISGQVWKTWIFARYWCTAWRHLACR